MPSAKKSVFISYSRKDQAIVQILAYFLRKEGLECVFDEQIQPTKIWNEELLYMISQVDHVILVLSESSTSSATVNQEIGIARALNKSIWPLPLNREIDPTGFINNVQKDFIRDWNKPEDTFKNLATTISECNPEVNNPYQLLGLERVIEGKIERTEFIVNKLMEIREEFARNPNKSPITVRSQSGFSIFCTSNESLYAETSRHPEEYIELLIQERDLLTELINNKNIFIKLILWPKRFYEADFIQIRFANLIDWLEEFKPDKHVEFVLAQAPDNNVPQNKYFLGEDIFIRGLKYDDSRGYGLNIIYHQKEYVKDKIAEFNGIFDFAARNQSKQTVIDKIREMSQVPLTSN